MAKGERADKDRGRIGKGASFQVSGFTHGGYGRDVKKDNAESECSMEALGEMQ